MSVEQFDDPILDEMFGGDAIEEDAKEFDPEYGKGKHYGAILREVKEQAATQYGHSAILEFDLKGDEGMPFKFFLNAPIKPEGNGHADERAVKGYEMDLRRLKSIVHSTGFKVRLDETDGKVKEAWSPALLDFSGDEGYSRFIALLSGLVGRIFRLNVDFYDTKQGKKRATVWGISLTKKDFE